MTSPLILSLIMFVAGIGIPIMAAMNASLGLRIGSTAAAASILFFVSLMVSGFMLALSGFPSKSSVFSAPLYLYAGGFFVAFYVLSVTWIAPRIGVGNAVFLVLLGQIVVAAIIDHYGLFDVMQTPITLTRVAGLLFMVVGVFLARRDF